MSSRSTPDCQPDNHSDDYNAGDNTTNEPPTRLNLREVGSNSLIRGHSHCGVGQARISYVTGPAIEPPATIWGGCDIDHGSLPIAMVTDLGSNRTTATNLHG